MYIVVAGRAEHLHVMLQAAHRILETVQPERQVQQRQVARLHEPDAAQRRQHGNGNAGGTRCGLCDRQPAAAAPAQPATVRRAERRSRTPSGRPPATDHQRRPQSARRYANAVSNKLPLPRYMERITTSPIDALTPAQQRRWLGGNFDVQDQVSIRDFTRLPSE